jgi:hypothetical protein
MSHDFRGVRTKATTIASDDGRAMAIVVVLCGVFAAVFPLFDRAHWWVWAKHILLVPAVVADLAIVAIASAWVLYWGFRLGVRFDDDGVTVRRIVKIDWYAWPEVSRFADGCYKTGHGQTIWALDVVLVDGQAVTLTATAGNSEPQDADGNQAGRRALRDPGGANRNSPRAGWVARPIPGFSPSDRAPDGHVIYGRAPQLAPRRPGPRHNPGSYALRGCSRAALAGSKTALASCSQVAAGGDRWLLTVVRGHPGGTRP